MLDELDAHIAELAEQSPPVSPSQPLVDETVKRPEVSVFTLNQMLARAGSSIQQLLVGLVLAQGVAMVGGPSDSGKSSLLRQFALAVALGEPTFLGFTLNAVHHRAICVSTEDGDMAVGPILKMQLTGRDVSEEVGDRLRFVFDTENLVQRLDQMLTEQPADLVVVDAFGDLYEGNLNQSNEVRAFVNKYHALAVRHNCLFLFLHHTGKRTEEREPSKHNMLGSQGLEAKMRVVFELRPDPVDHTLRHLCVLKGNYLPRETKAKSYALHFDENLLFHNTGVRAEFGDLLKAPAETAEMREFWDRALMMDQAGDSLSKVHTQLQVAAQDLGIIPCPSRSTVDRRLKVMRATVSSSQTLENEMVKRETAA